MGKKVIGSFFDEVMSLQSYQQAYEEERVVIDFAETLASYMHDKSLSMHQLAERLDVSPSYVCQVLKGQRNVSLRSAARYLFKLGLRMKMGVEAIEERSVSNEMDLFRERPSSWFDNEKMSDYRLLMVNRVSPDDIRTTARQEEKCSYSECSGDEYDEVMVVAA